MNIIIIYYFFYVDRFVDYCPLCNQNNVKLLNCLTNDGVHDLKR